MDVRSSRFVFGAFDFDCVRGELRCRGVAIRIENKPLQLLD